MSRISAGIRAEDGVVSVVMVVGDGELTAVAETLAALGALVPGDREVEIVLAGSSAVVPGLADLAPTATVVDGGAVEHPGALANLAAARARGEYLAFVAPGHRPEPRWLVGASDVFHADAATAAVASWVLRGETVVFATPGVAITGDLVSIDAGRRVAELPRADVDALWASPGGLVVEARAFAFVGGYDESLGGAAGSLDLGWRLHLAGLRLVSSPRSRVQAPVAVAEEHVGPDADTLSVLVTNLGEDSMALLGAATLVTSRRPGGGAVVEQLDARMAGLLERRAAVQAVRTVPEPMILAMFRSADDVPGLDRNAVHGMLEQLGAWRWFAARRRVAVVTPDVLRSKMAGPAIRAWRMAIALARRHEVRLVSTVECTLEHPQFETGRVDDHSLRTLEAWCDVLIFQGHVMANHPWLVNSTKVIVVDIYDPIHLEVLEQSRDRSDWDRRHLARSTVEVLNQQLLRGDHFLCASEKQRDFWLGQLAALGRINPVTYDDGENLEGLLSIVPFGLDDEPPSRTRPALRGVVPGIGADDKVIIWGGGVYNWFDPLTLVRAVDKLRHRVPEVRLFFMGMSHPNPEVPAMRMATDTREEAERLDLVGTHVFFNDGWVAYDDRQNYLLDADLGVSTHLDHVETAFSFRTRILDYLWASLPIVATEGDSFGELIELHGLGRTVPPGDVDALEDALFGMLTDDDRRARCAAAVAALAPRFTWTKVLAPVLAVCDAPRRAPDLVDPRQRVMVGDPVAQVLWGRRGWRHTLTVLLGHLRRREYDEVARKVRMRIRAALFPESTGSGTGS